MTSLTYPSQVAEPYGPGGSGPADAPRMVRQRRIRRGWVGIGVLAIVLAALGAATLFRALGPSQEYLAVAQDVPVGAMVTPEDLQVVRINSAPGLNPVSVSDADQVVGSYAAVPLHAGALVTPDQVTSEAVPGPGEQLVAINLSRDRLPGRTLSSGDPVMLVSTSSTELNAGDEGGPRTFTAEVHDVQPAGGRGTELVVSLLVADRDGATVAGLAASGRVAVVLLPATTQTEETGS